jgi:protease-4
VDNLGQGRIWSGTEALRLGLVDTLGGFDAAVKLAARLAKLTEYRLSALPAQKDPLQQLLEELSGESSPEVFLKQTLREDYTYYQVLKTIREMKGIQARMPFTLQIQ